jgi:hypothetical protein
VVVEVLVDEWSVWDADVHLYTEEFGDVSAAWEAAEAERASYAELGIRRNLEIHLRRRWVSAWDQLELAELEPPRSLLVDERALHAGGQELRREYRVRGLLDDALRTLSLADTIDDAAECARMWQHAGVLVDRLDARWATSWRRVQP